MLVVSSWSRSEGGAVLTRRPVFGKVTRMRPGWRVTRAASECWLVENMAWRGRVANAGDWRRVGWEEQEPHLQCSLKKAKGSNQNMLARKGNVLSKKGMVLRYAQKRKRFVQKRNPFVQKRKVSAIGRRDTQSVAATV